MPFSVSNMLVVLALLRKILVYMSRCTGYLCVTSLSPSTRGKYKYIYKDQFNILLLPAKEHLKTYKESTSYDYLSKNQEGAKLNGKCIIGSITLGDNV